jgi:hypothetical protein
MLSGFPMLNTMCKCFYHAPLLFRVYCLLRESVNMMMIDKRAPYELLMSVNL